MPQSPLDPTSSGAMITGQLVGDRYELVSCIARGGMAEVWEAEDTVLTRPVAVKILLPHLAADDAFLTRFRREAVAAARLSHPHIVSIFDTCAGPDCEAIVMELVRGRTVREALDEGGPLPVRHAVHIAAQVADALAHAHANGLVHRDVKPGNILLSDDGRVLVADFGIAKAAEANSDLTEVGQVVGTAKYLSPEQVRGEPIDPRSDIYSLGVVLYEMVCARPPFSGENATATALARLTGDPLRPRQVRAGIPRAVEDLILRAMARSPESRFATAEDFRRALESVDLTRVDGDGDDATSAHAVGDPTPLPGSAPGFAQSERSWIVPAALIVVVAMTLGVVGLLVGRSEVGRDLFRTTRQTDTPAPVSLTGVPASFDPDPGDGRENDDSLDALVDGDPATTWQTERYDTRALGGLKPGVGIVLALDSAAALDTLAIDAPSAGWRGQVYVADRPEAALAEWGEPVGDTFTAPGGPFEVDLEDRRGAAVLVWITDLGPRSGDGHRVEIGEIRLTA